MHVVYKHGVYHCIYTVLIVDTQLYKQGSESYMYRINKQMDI